MESFCSCRGLFPSCCASPITQRLFKHGEKRDPGNTPLYKSGRALFRDASPSFAVTTPHNMLQALNALLNAQYRPIVEANTRNFSINFSHTRSSTRIIIDNNEPGQFLHQGLLRNIANPIRCPALAHQAPVSQAGSPTAPRSHRAQCIERGGYTKRKIHV